MINLLKRIFNWESFGMLIQLLIWAAIIFILIVFMTAGFKIDEFRYVGF